MQTLTAPLSRTVRRQPRKLSGTMRWVKRGLKVGTLLIATGIVSIYWRSGQLEAALNRVGSDAIVVSAKFGFRVEQVDVIGRDQTDPKALLAAAGLKRGDPILMFSPEAARQRIEGLPWVASAAVERRLPDTVAITIIERRPIALWQHNEKISLIDSAGANLGTVAIETAPPLPLVVGGDAPSHASELLGLLAEHPDIEKRVQASSWIGSRRWDLKLDNGIEVRLPEVGVAEALRQLAEAEASSRLLERDVAAIDLRLAGKMVVRLAHEASQPVKTKPQQGI